MKLLEKLNKIFQMVFDDEDIIIDCNTTAEDIDGWDSLSHVNLITSIESYFDIKFSPRDLLTLRNVGDLHQMIASKLPE